MLHRFLALLILFLRKIREYFLDTTSTISVDSNCILYSNYVKNPEDYVVFKRSNIAKKEFIFFLDMEFEKDFQIFNKNQLDYEECKNSIIMLSRILDLISSSIRCSRAFFNSFQEFTAPFLHLFISCLQETRNYDFACDRLAQNKIKDILNFFKKRIRFSNKLEFKLLEDVFYICVNLNYITADYFIIQNANNRDYVLLLTPDIIRAFTKQNIHSNLTKINSSDLIFCLINYYFSISKFSKHDEAMQKFLLENIKKTIKYLIELGIRPRGKELTTEANIFLKEIYSQQNLIFYPYKNIHEKTISLLNNITINNKNSDDISYTQNNCKS